MWFLQRLTGGGDKPATEPPEDDFTHLLAPDERLLRTFRLMREHLIFTNRRLVLVERQGLLGRKRLYQSVPYRSITHFSVETAGSLGLDAQLRIWVSGMAAPVHKILPRRIDVHEVQALLAANVT